LTSSEEILNFGIIAHGDEQVLVALDTSNSVSIEKIALRQRNNHISSHLCGMPKQPPVLRNQAYQT
jgi:hypothetical protein